MKCMCCNVCICVQVDASILTTIGQTHDRMSLRKFFFEVYISALKQLTTSWLPLLFPHIFVWGSVSRRLLLRPFFATSIFHTPSLTTTIFHTPSFTHHLSHRTLSTTIFPTPPFTPNFVTPSFTHHFVTHHLSHNSYHTHTGVNFL